MNEEALQELERMIDGPLDARDAVKAIRDLIKAQRELIAERDYAQKKLIEFKQDRAAQQQALRNFIGI